MGFAYGPDGAFDDQEELEPGITVILSDCKKDLSCPRPMYMIDGEYLGKAGTDNFGLDDYEPKFFLPLLDWIDQGTFSINVNFNETISQDIFYFCHVRSPIVEPKTTHSVCTSATDPSFHERSHQDPG